MKNHPVIKVVTNDKYTDFVLSNWRNIISIEEVVKKAQETLPNWLIGQTRDVFKVMERGYFQKSKMHAEELVEDDDTYDNFYWDPCGRYDHINWEGPSLVFFYSYEIEGIWDYLRTEELESAPRLCLYIEANGKKARRKTVVEKWVKHINKYVSQLKRNRHIIIPPDMDVDRPEVVYYRLDKVFTIAMIQDKQAFRKAFEEAMIAFTEIMRPIIKSGPRGIKKVKA